MAGLVGSWLGWRVGGLVGWCVTARELERWWEGSWVGEWAGRWVCWLAGEWVGCWELHSSTRRDMNNKLLT